MVYVMGSPYGFAIVFETEKELEAFTEHLQGMKKAAAVDEDASYPLLYSRCHEDISEDEHNNYAEWLKAMAQFGYAVQCSDQYGAKYAERIEDDG